MQKIKLNKTLDKRKSSKISILFVMLFFLNMIFVINLNFENEVKAEGRNSYTPHAPIDINGDSGFTSANGVSSGNGTENNPYIIEGWDINASIQNGVDIENTDAYFIIRNCFVHDGGSNYDGFYFSDVKNGTIKNCLIENNLYGFLLYSSSSNNINNNNIYSNNNFGIELWYSSSNDINNNDISNNDYGIVFGSSSNNNISHNSIYSNNYDGIELVSSSSNNTITNNSISNNTEYGIFLWYSSNNTMRNNTIINSQYNFWVYGEQIFDYYQDIDTTNNVNGKPIYYVQNQSNLIYDGNSTMAGYFGFLNCNNITIKNYEIKNNGQGILLVNTSNSLITNNNFSNNFYGVNLLYSTNNTITNNSNSGNLCGHHIFYSSNYNSINNNDIHDNEYYGIHFSFSSNNSIGDNHISNQGWYGIYFVSSSNQTIENSTISNSTLYDFRLESKSEDDYAINTTFNNTNVSISSDSELIIKNYLEVKTEDRNSIPLENAIVSVKDNGDEIFNETTDENGLISWILITDRIYNGSSTATENETIVKVRYRNFTFNNNPRNVNVSISHREIFKSINSIYALLDLSPTLYISHRNILENDNITISAIIKNIGNAKAVNFTVKFYIDDISVRNFTISLNFNASEILSFNFTFEKGNHTIKVVVDEENFIDETNEENNIAELEILVNVSSGNVSSFYMNFFMIIVVAGLVAILRKRF